MNYFAGNLRLIICCLYQGNLWIRTKWTDPYGDFESRTGTGWRIYTPVGYYSWADSANHYVVRDYLGSTRVVYKPVKRSTRPLLAAPDMAISSGTYAVEQRTGYFANGTPVNLSDGSATTRLHTGKEWLNLEGAGLYENAARLHDPLLGRFTTADALADKYQHLSPYTHCAANPVNYLDLNGNDIFILNWIDGGLHLAMLIQNSHGKWQYYSINGDKMNHSLSGSVGRPFNDIGVGSWDSPEDFLNSNYNQVVENNEDVNYNYFGYDEGYLIHSSPEQDEIMRNEFAKLSKTPYCLTPGLYDTKSNNCATTVQRVMVKAGIPVSEPKYKSSYKTYSTEIGLIEVYDGEKMECDINIIPQKAYKSIIKYNPGGEIIQKSN